MVPTHGKAAKQSQTPKPPTHATHTHTLEMEAWKEPLSVNFEHDP